MKGAAVINLSGKAFNIDELRAILGRHSTSVRLDLSSAQIRWADCLKIATLLDQFPACSVVSLDLSNNAIGFEGVAALCGTATLFRELRELNLSKCLIEGVGAAAVGEAMRESKLRYLNLTGNNIGSYGVGAFSVRGLVGNVSLEVLILDSNNIGDAGAEELANGVLVHSSLLELSLYDNSIGPPGATALSAALCKHETLLLQKLNLGRNAIQKDGAAPLATLLAKNDTLMSLDISENSLGGSKLDAVLILSTGYDGVVSLADSLKTNRTLLSLNLSGNKIGKVGMRAFSDALASNKFLSQVLFDNADHVELVESGIKHNRSVTNVGCDVTVGSISSSIARNIKERDLLLQSIGSGAPVAKIKAVFDKGVDVFHEDVMVLVRKASPELIAYFHTLPHVRNLMFSSTTLLDNLGSLSPGALKAFARERGALTCLLFAARIGHVEAVKIMLRHEADPNQKDTVLRTPLHLATEHGHVEAVTALLQGGANPKEMLHGLSLLLLAVRNGHVALVELLLQRFPAMRDLRSPPPKARSVLHVAAKSGRRRVVALLLESGMDPNIVSGDGRVPLHMAATPGVCKLLLDAGANLKVLTPDGRDAVYYALFPERKVAMLNEQRVESPNLDVVTFLLENHADKKAAFEEVRNLDLRHMYRDSVPVWIGQLPKLETLQVCLNNSLSLIPENVVAGGDSQVLMYLRDIAVGTKDVWQGFKVMVLGKEGVGKTHIYHLCRGEDYKRNASTDGIDVNEVLLGPEKVPAKWFDFGGQEVFYPTHELFLTGQCVYLIAFKMEEPEYDKRVEYWLKVVQTFAQDKAKVVVVGTHRDKIKDEAELTAIRQRINEITALSTTVVDKLYISCLDDPVAVREELAAALLAAAQQAKLGGKEVPHIYNVIKHWAKDQRDRRKVRPYFTWDAFVECFPGYDSYLLERACEFLHDQGEMFLAKRFVSNKKANIVCPDIQWIAKAFCAVVTFRHNWVKDGILRQEALVHIWKDYNVVDMQDMLAIMSLFEKFNIAFARREDGVWVIPSMLPADPPPAALRLPENLTHSRLYRLSVVPSGAFGQVVARLLEWTDIKVLAVWRFGIVLRDTKDIAALTVEDSDISLRILKAPQMAPEELLALGATATGSGSLLRRLDEELQQIFKFVFRRMNTLPLETFILCPHCIAGGVPESDCKWLKYDDVVRLVLSGEPTFRCSGGEVPLERMGEDLTLGYVQAFPNSMVKVEKEALARGGFGMIFKGVMKNGAKIVVKELIMEPGTEVSLFADFQREVSLMAQLRHENLVQMHGILLSPLRMVLELCAEGDLLGALRKGKIKDEMLKLRVALDVAQGMQFLHAQMPPLAHRDLRSPNVLLMSLRANSKEPVAKVADFGLTAAASSRLQQELLTWQWMAPEAFLGENYTETCDLYSYGMVLWEIYKGTGEIPFESLAAEEKHKKKQAREFMNDIIHKGLRPTCGADFPEEVTELILRLWEKDATTRPTFPVCVEVLQGLQSGTKRPDGFLKTMLSRDRSKAPTPGARKDLPVVNLAVSSMAGAFREPMVSCAMRPSVKGYRETIWLGGGQGSVLVVDTSGTRLHERKAAHAGSVKVLQALAVDGSVWSGGADGIVRQWQVTFPMQNLGQADVAVASPAVAPPVTPPRPVRPAASANGSAPASPASSWSSASLPRAGAAGGPTIGRRVAAAPANDASVVGSAGSKSPRAAAAAPLNNSASTALRPSTSLTGLRTSSSGAQTSSSALKVSERRRQSPPEFECVQGPEQPHQGAEINAMLALDQLGVMVVGDSRGTVAVWSRDGAVLFKTKLPLSIKALCCESESRIWVAEGASLHRVEISDAGELRVAHSFKARHETGFLGLALAGQTLWASDGPDLKLIDTSTDTVVKIVQQPAATAINCMACVSAYGTPTVWCGSNGLVSLWSVKAKSSIKSYVDLPGEVLFIQEVGENLVLVSFAGKLHLFDLHTQS